MAIDYIYCEIIINHFYYITHISLWLTNNTF